MTIERFVKDIVGAGIILVGLSIFLFFGCRVATNGIILLTKGIAFGVKKVFRKRRKFGEQGNENMACCSRLSYINWVHTFRGCDDNAGRGFYKISNE